MAKQALNHYFAWEGEHMVEHTKLMNEYNSLKENEHMVIEQSGGKNKRREQLLEEKAENTISKQGIIELAHIDKEYNINTKYDRDIKTIEDRRNNAIDTAEEEYKRMIRLLDDKLEKAKRDAEDKYNTALCYYDNEKNTSISKETREYEHKMRVLQMRGESLERQKENVFKTSTEITLEKQKHDILVKLKKSIAVWKMSRSQLSGNPDFGMPIPELPEPIIERVVSVKKREESDEFTPSMPDWLKRLGEDSELAVLREQARQEENSIKKQMQEEPSRKTVYGFVGPGVGADVLSTKNEMQTIIFENCIDASTYK